MPQLHKETKLFAASAQSFCSVVPKGLVMKMTRHNLSQVLLPLFFAPAFGFAQTSMNCDRPVEDFSTKTVGAFPEGFVAHDESKLKKVIAQGNYYSVKQDEDTNSYLNAVANKDGLIIHKDVENWNLDEYPYLRWRWRAKQFPKGGNEKYIRANDAAASVYVVWKASSLMRVKSIKFTWSSTLDVGTYISKRFGLDHIQVLQNQRKNVGQWVEQTVDVRGLFRKYYEPEDGKLARPLAIAVLSDADATDSVAEADYDDFTLCRGTIESPKPASVPEMAPGVTAPKR